MRFYAERPWRAARQLLADVLVLLWVVLVVDVGRAARALVERLQGPARTLTDAGESMRGVFDSAASTASRVPLVGDDLARALGPGSGAGESLARSGREQVEVVSSVAWGTAVVIVALGVLPVLAVWAPIRLRYARAAGSAVRVRRTDTSLLALRAMAHLPVRELLAVSPEPAAAWRRDDRAAVDGLAALELHSLGLYSPADAARATVPEISR
jgi:hypothetical protein